MNLLLDLAGLVDLAGYRPIPETAHSRRASFG